MSKTSLGSSASSSKRKRKGMSPRTLHGGMHSDNDCVSWGWQGIAFGCQSLVVVIDPMTCQVIQTLDNHKSPVTKVAWEVDRSGHDIAHPYRLRLVSGEASGRIIIWDVNHGTALVECSDSVKNGKGRPVVQLEWIHAKKTKNHPFGFIMALHAASPLVLYDAANGELIWKADLNEKCRTFSLDPFDLSRMVLLTDNALMIVDDLGMKTAPARLGNKYHVTADNDTQQQSGALLGARFSPHDPHQLFLIFSREIMIMDLEIHQTIGTVMLERGSAAFRDVAITKNRLLYCLHDNGIISVRDRGPSLKDSYIFKAQSEALRLSKNARVQSLAVNPSDPTQIVSCLTDGKTLFYKFSTSAYNGISVPRILLQGSRDALATVSCVAVAPPKASGRDSYIVALGTTAGQIQIVNLATDKILSQHAPHIDSVDEITWANSDLLLSFSVTESGGGLYRSRICRLDTRNGRVTRIRDKTAEASRIIMLRVSFLQQYFVVVFNDRPMELWDFRTGVMLKKMSSSFPVVVDIQWSPSIIKQEGKREPEEQPAMMQIFFSFFPVDTAITNIKEYYIIVMPDGNLSCFTVEGSVVRNATKFSCETQSIPTCMAWKGESIVTGDSTGGLRFWDLKGRTPKIVASGFGVVKQVSFAPGRNSRVIVLFADGIATYDASTKEVLVNRKFSKKDTHHPVKVCWIAGDRPVVLSSDGCIRVYDVWLQTSCSPISSYKMEIPVRIPHVLDPLVALHLKTLMQLSLGEEYKLEPYQTKDDDFVADAPPTTEELIQAKVNTAIQLLPRKVKQDLESAAGSTIERCLITAKYFGDEVEHEFWTLCQFYLRDNTQWPQDIGEIATPTSPSTKRLVDIRQQSLASIGKSSEKDLSEAEARPEDVEEEEQESLPGHFGLMCSSADVRNATLDHLNLHDSRTLTYEMTHLNTQRHVLMGQYDRATNLLLETNVRHENFYTDSLRACIVTAISSPDTAQNTIKLVAMNLIASDKLMEGVELLCLIGNGLDACRYLQTFQKWDLAARLAKARLTPIEAAEIFQRWAEHLSLPSVGQQMKAASVLISFHQFSKAVAFLHSIGRYELACLLVTIVREERGINLVPQRRRNSSTPVIAAGPSLYEGLFKSYAKYLRAIMNSKAAKCFEKLSQSSG